MPFDDTLTSNTKSENVQIDILFCGGYVSHLGFAKSKRTAKSMLHECKNNGIWPHVRKILRNNLRQEHVKIGRHTQALYYNSTSVILDESKICRRGNFVSLD